MPLIRKICREIVLRKRGLSRVCANRNFSSSSSEKFVVNSSFSDVDIPRVPVDQLVFKHAHKWGHKIAVECGVTGRKYTYDELRKYIENFNRALRKKFKLQNPDVVAIMMPNVPEYPIASFGILQAGLIVTPINPIYTEEELARQLTDSNAKLIVTLNSFAKPAKAALLRAKKNIPVIAVLSQRGESLEEGVVDFQQLIAQEFDIKDAPERNLDSLALLPYSSGTTGLPKGVELTNQNVCANVMQCTSPEVALFKYAEGTYQEITPAVLPMFHIYGTESLIWFLHFGAKVITLPRFTPELYAATLVNYKPRHLFVVPPIVVFLTVFPGITQKHLESIEYINSGAAPLGALDEEKLKVKAGRDIKILQGYGLSESPVITVTSAIKPKIPGAVGEPLSNTSVKIVAIDDPEEKALGPNQTGELFVKGPQVMSGYYNNPEATANSFSNGWFKTGDLGFYTEDKKFFVTDRIKELIKVKGFQVAPAELEEIIRDYKGVADACVIGVPHELYGEVPRAYIVPKRDETVDTNKLSEYVAGKVASFKKLDGGIAVVDTIPKNASGKLLRRQLKQMYLDEVKQ